MDTVQLHDFFLKSHENIGPLHIDDFLLVMDFLMKPMWNKE